MGSKKAPAAPGSPVDTGQIQDTWNQADTNTQAVANNQAPQQAYDFFAPQLMNATPYGYDPAQAVNYANQWSAQGPQMFQYANQAMNEGFDPQNEFYNRTATQQQNQMRASQGARGTQMTPYGAGLENEGMSNFNLDWRMQQLQRQNTAANTASQLWNQGGQAIQGGQQLAQGVPQNIAGYAGALQQLGMNATSPQQWAAQQYGNMFGQGTAAQQGAYKGQLDQHNSNVSASNATWGGIGKLAGQIGSAAIMASDRRLKKDIVKLGDDPRGWGIYNFKYNLDSLEHLGECTGYMADEVELVRPDAVLTHPSTGIKFIDYSRL